jgi:type II secretory pathway pseudopilin PulG
MGLPTTGPISLGDIAGEFGGSPPHRMSEYYAVVPGVPVSPNPIRLGDFRGKANNPDPPTWNGQDLNLGYKSINAYVSVNLLATSDSPVTFSLISAPGGIGSISGSTFSVTVPSTTGSRTWTIRATDAENQTADINLTIHAVRYGYSRGIIPAYNYTTTATGGGYYISGKFFSNTDVVVYENGADRYGYVTGNQTSETYQVLQPGYPRQELQFEAGPRYSGSYYGDFRYLGEVDASFDRWADGFIDDIAKFYTFTDTYWTQGYINQYTYSTTAYQPQQTLYGTYYTDSDVNIYQNGAWRYGYVDESSYGIVQY